MYDIVFTHRSKRSEPGGMVRIERLSKYVNFLAPSLRACDKKVSACLCICLTVCPSVCQKNE